MAELIVNAQGERKCMNKGCTEVATRKVMLMVNASGECRPKLAYLCEGHAWLSFGSVDNQKITQCPCCGTMFVLKEIPGESCREGHKSN